MSHLSAWRAMVKADVIALLRSRTYAAFLAAGVVLLLASLLVAELSLGESETIVADLGLAFLSVLSVAVGATVVIVDVANELESRQALVLLSRPIPRGLYVLSKFSSSLLVVLAANVILGAALAVVIAVLGGTPLPVFIAVVYGTFEGAIIIAIAIAIGVGSSPALTASMVAVIFLVGRLDRNLTELIERGTFGGATTVVEGIARGLPHLSLYDLTPWVDGQPMPSVPLGLLYFALYTGAFLALAISRLASRDLA